MWYQDDGHVPLNRVGRQAFGGWQTHGQVPAWNVRLSLRASFAGCHANLIVDALLTRVSQLSSFVGGTNFITQPNFTQRCWFYLYWKPGSIRGTTRSFLTNQLEPLCRIVMLILRVIKVYPFTRESKGPWRGPFCPCFESIKIALFEPFWLTPIL